MSIDLGKTIRDAVTWDTAAQFEGFSKIERKGGELVRPVANIHQKRMDAAVKAARKAKRPCRIIGLKPRQKGSSTYTVKVGHVRLKAKRGRGIIAGGAHFQGSNLFRILKTYAETDELDPKSCKVMDMDARFTNGSSIDRITLANSNAGRSGTYQYLCVTEAAYLADEGVANADAVLDGLLKCVPHEEDTIIIIESTANGASGYFFDAWQQGITLEEFEGGRNGYVKIFSAWFEFEDSRTDPAGEGVTSEADLRPEEIAYARERGLTLDLWQYAWMRLVLRDECKGDWNKFQQDYPSDAETAFLKSGRGMFSSSSIKWQEEVSKIRLREFGYLQYNEHADRIQWVRTEEVQARSVRWEGPIPGCRYLLCADTMTGADQTGGQDPDSHAVFVLRGGYLRSGVWNEPAVVMRNMMVPGSKPGSLCCWWGIDVLEEEVWRMARYYQAIIAPEMNMDRGLMELLKLRGDVDIYQREVFNRRESEYTKALGWMTTTLTRPMILEGLVAVLRESGKGGYGQGFEVRCPWAIAQMKSFIVRANGRAEASGGHHDDDILSLAIGVQLLDMATAWGEHNREEFMPSDLRALRDRRRNGGGGGQFT